MRAPSGKLRVVIGFLIVALMATVLINYRSPPMLSPDLEPAAKPIAPSIPVSAAQLPERNGPVAPEILARGKTVYLSQCAICHGDDGTGKGKAARLLSDGPKPAWKPGGRPSRRP